MNLKGKRILVTGATGFNGSHLTKCLMKSGAEVHVLHRSSSSFWRLNKIKEKLHLHNIDISDPISVFKICKEINPKIVYHLAAYGANYRDQDIQQAFDINLIGTINLIKGLKGTECKKLIFTDTFFAYGHQDAPIRETTLLKPSTPYASTKISASYLAPLFAKKFELPLIILRLFNVYGPLDDTSRFIPYIILSLYKKEIPKLTGCRQIRDFIFVDDVVEACLKAIEINHSTILNVGSGVPVTLKSVVNEILKYFEDGRIEFDAIPYRKDEIWKSYADMSKAKKILDWEAKVSLQDGIFKTVKSFNRNI